MRDVNILLDILPASLVVEDTEYEIDTNFRTGICFEQLLTAPDINSDMKLATALVMYYGKTIPPNRAEAIKAIIRFYRCGLEPKIQKSTTAKSAIGRRRMDKIYDFDADAAYFYAAFLAQYQIDLNDIDYLHWWKFMALFEGLKRDNELLRIMEIRATDATAIENPKEKNRILRLQEHYRIDAGLTAEDKADIAGAIFGGAQ